MSEQAKNLQTIVERTTLVKNTLGKLIEPKLKWTIEALNLIKKVEIVENTLNLNISLITLDESAINQFRDECFEVLAPLKFETIDLKLNSINIATEGINGVKNILLVGSGKGGVGKSTVSVNLASSLTLLGYKTGLMDADIYGPSVPTMLGITQKPQVLPNEYLMPIQAHDISVMSLGLIYEEGKSVPWRGSLASGTLIQFIQKTLWNKLDFLVIDLPPGTGDIQLTLAHKIKSLGAVVVTTPQEVALGDVRRAVDLYKDQKIPILGVVENMTGYLCESCGHKNHPFVKSKSALNIENATHYQLLLSKELSLSTDQGEPLVKTDPSNIISEQFKTLAQGIVNIALASA